MAQEIAVDRWRGRFWTFAPVFVWIGVIFFFSSPQGAMTETSRIIGPLINFFFPEMAEVNRQIVHAYVRKTAHFTEYAILAFLAVRMCSATIFLAPWRYLLPIILVALIATLDEFNQSFIASRTSSVWDVLLDISGGAAMTAFLWLIGRPRLETRMLPTGNRPE